MAALHGHPNIIEYLLKHDIDLEVPDMLGLTAQDYAEKSNHSACETLIQEKLSLLAQENIE